MFIDFITSGRRIEFVQFYVLSRNVVSSIPEEIIGFLQLVGIESATGFSIVVCVD
jgi:hypothetical protein